MRVELIGYAVNNLMTRKLRSWLTALSILIGIMAVFALVSFGLGIRSYVDTLSAEAGADKLLIMPRTGLGLDSSFYISQNDVDFVAKINGVKDIVGMYFRAGSIKSDKVTKYNFVIGLDPTKDRLVEETFTVHMEKGRALKKGDTSKVLLGYNYMLPDKIFKKPIKLGDKVEIQGEQLEVVGFYSEVGNPQDDGNIYVTDKEMENLYPGIEGKFGEVMLQAQPDVNPTELADRITEKLRKRYDEKKGQETFYVQTFADLIETFSIVLDVINGVLVLIALISIVVASVNIMNTMYTAVLQRTKEIGVMKAIGARNSDILVIFVVESGLLGAVGGAIGVFFGYLVASLGGYIAAVSGYSSLQPVFPWYLILGSLAFSFVIGAGSGLLPARQASKLRPVDALRYE